jgi:serine/threonine protein kinase
LRRIGRYEIVCELGRGAMGVVYKARDPQIGRSVAVKTITSGVAHNPDLLDRFYREAKSAGLLQHANIVTIYELSESDGAPFIAMEYLEGESLEQLIGRRPLLPLAQKLGYIVQACRAFDYAHRRGVVHRDIKPANIMITREGVVKVVDFGIARIADSSKTQSGGLLGTLAYMSPEQLRGQPADERCDIWSLGAVLYETLSYRKPFTGDNHGALIRSILEDNPPPLRELFPEIPAALENAIARAFCKDAPARYQTMESLLLDLEPMWSQLQQETVLMFLKDARTHIAQEEKSEARRILEQASLVDDKNLAVKSLLEELNTALGKSHTIARAREFLVRGERLLAEGLFFDARVEVQSALKLDPENEEALRLQKQVQLQQSWAQEPPDQLKPRTEKHLAPAQQFAAAPTEFQLIPPNALPASPRRFRAAVYVVGAAVAIGSLGLLAYRSHFAARPVRAAIPAVSQSIPPPIRNADSLPAGSSPASVADAVGPAAAAATDFAAAPESRSAPLLSPPSPPPSIADRQRRLIDLARAAADADDYESAEARLDEAARLNGSINPQIADLRREFAQQRQRWNAAHHEQTLWDEAVKDIQAGQLDDAEKSLRQLITLPEATRHRREAEHYVDRIIPQRRHYDQLWADLQQDSRSVSPDHFENELRTLDKILILGGTRQQEARQLRERRVVQLVEANARRSRRPLDLASAADRTRFAGLQDEFDQAVQQGDAEALQQLQNLRPQLRSLARGESLLSIDARDYLNNLVPRAQRQIQDNLAAADSDAAADTEYESAVKHYNQALAAGDHAQLRSGPLTEFRQIVSFGGVRASEAAEYVNVLIPQALKDSPPAHKYAGLSAQQSDPANQ